MPYKNIGSISFQDTLQDVGEFPFVYRERQLHSALVPAISNARARSGRRHFNGTAGLPEVQKHQHYQSSKNKDTLRKYEREALEEAYHQFLGEINPAPKWSCLWYLHERLQESFEYEDGRFEIYPCVALVADGDSNRRVRDGDDSNHPLGGGGLWQKNEVVVVK